MKEMYFVSFFFHLVVHFCLVIVTDILAAVSKANHKRLRLRLQSFSLSFLTYLIELLCFFDKLRLNEEESKGFFIPKNEDKKANICTF